MVEQINLFVDTLSYSVLSEGEFFISIAMYRLREVRQNPKFFVLVNAANDRYFQKIFFDFTKMLSKTKHYFLTTLSTCGRHIITFLQ